jgi:hypothetical protein
LTQQKADTPIYKLGERAQINTQLGELQQQKSGLMTEFRRIPEKIEGLRDQAAPYTGDIASSETVVRAMNPNRLQTLVEAITPLPGQEAPVRVVDLTPAERAKRIADAQFAKETRNIWYSAENDSSRFTRR